MEPDNNSSSNRFRPYPDVDSGILDPSEHAETVLTRQRKHSSRRSSPPVLAACIDIDDLESPSAEVGSIGNPIDVDDYDNNLHSPTIRTSNPQPNSGRPERLDSETHCPKRDLYPSRTQRRGLLYKTGTGASRWAEPARLRISTIARLDKTCIANTQGHIKAEPQHETLFLQDSMPEASTNAQDQHFADIVDEASLIEDSGSGYSSSEEVFRLLVGEGKGRATSIGPPDQQIEEPRRSVVQNRCFSKQDFGEDQSHTISPSGHSHVEENQGQVPYTEGSRRSFNGEDPAASHNNVVSPTDSIIRAVNDLGDSVKDVCATVKQVLQKQYRSHDNDHDADDESDTNAQRMQYLRPKKRLVKRTTTRKQRPHAKLQLAKSVRDHLVKLIGRENLLVNTVTPSEAASAGASIQCTAQNFRIQIDGAPSSAWNRSAGKVFADSLINATDYADTPEMRQVIYEAFITHVGFLIGRYRHKQKPRIEQETTRKRAAKQQRKSSLFHRRYDITLKHKAFSRHRQMLELLGAGGMSSDESDFESGQLQYRILRLRWRADTVTTWLRVLDAMHLYDRVEGDPSLLRGAHPRTRILSCNYSSSTRFVPGLPTNAYRQAWLDNHHDVTDTVQPSSVPYAFEHREDAIQLCRQWLVV